MKIDSSAKCLYFGYMISTASEEGGSSFGALESYLQSNSFDQEAHSRLSLPLWEALMVD